MKVVFSIVQDETKRELINSHMSKLIYKKTTPIIKQYNEEPYILAYTILSHLTEESLKKRMLIGMNIDEIASKIKEKSLKIYSTFINNIIENNLGHIIYLNKTEREQHEKPKTFEQYNIIIKLGKVFSNKSEINNQIFNKYSLNQIYQNSILVPSAEILQPFGFHFNETDLESMTLTKS